MSAETRLESLESLVGEMRTTLSRVAANVETLPLHFEQSLRSVQNNMEQRVTSTAELLARQEADLAIAEARREARNEKVDYRFGKIEERVDVLESHHDQHIGGRRATDRVWTPMRSVAAGVAIGVVLALLERIIN